MSLGTHAQPQQVMNEFTLERRIPSLGDGSRAAGQTVNPGCLLQIFSIIIFILQIKPRFGEAK